MDTPPPPPPPLRASTDFSSFTTAYASFYLANMAPDPIEAEQAQPGAFRSACDRTQTQFNRICAAVPALRPSARMSNNRMTRAAVPAKVLAAIPRTSPERLAQAAPGSEDQNQDTVLYLAYGSNMCAQTFLGMLGIKPLSQVNVNAPAFDLSFDLPGLPYWEPCFANLTPRKLPKPPKFPPPPPFEANEAETTSPSSSSWNKGLYGVVYEVTRADYAHIVATEGGGASYQNIITLCFALPPAVHIPEKDRPLPELPPKPFLARTLYAPRLPLPDDDDNDSNGKNSDGDDGDEKKPSWWSHFLTPVRRPSPDHALASPRYLGLLRSGAAEHALPDDYQRYMASLRAYEATSLRQQVGRYLFAATFLPWIFLGMKAGQLLADPGRQGQVPRWVGACMVVMFNVMWGVYDAVFRPVFGEGERTVGVDDDSDDDEGGEDVEREYVARGGRRRRRSSWWRDAVRGQQDGKMSGGEKGALLDDWEDNA